MTIRARLMLLLVWAAPCAHAAPTPPTPTLAFTDVGVVPMDSDRVLEHQNVLIKGDRIEAMGPVATLAVPPEATRIDGRGKWLMPGLIDMHVHLNDARDGALYVANGVTTIRSMWGAPETLEWRKEYLSGKELGPTVFTTGAILDGKPPIWPGSAVIESADDAEREVAAEKAAGYDFVKVYSKLSPVAYTAILEAAKRHGMRVVGHVPEAVGLLEVLSAGGQTSIEHLTGYMSAAQTEKSKAAEMSDWNGRRKEMVAHIDDAKIPILARKTQVAGTWSCVTLLVYQRFFQLEHLEELMKLPEVKYVVPEMLKMWDPANDFRFKGTTQEDFAAMRAVLAFHMRMTRALKDAGAKILLGTDTSNPFVVAGFAVHQELSLLVEAGLTPYEAIRAGTSDGADFLGAGDDFGRVRPGLRADLVLVDGNPLADVRAAARRSGVVLRGRWIPASDLDAQLENLAK